MRYCSIVNCKNRQGKSPASVISFHRFPANVTARKKWLLVCGLDENFDCAESRVCSVHFSHDDYERDLKGELLGEPLKKRLKQDAVPHLNVILIKREPPDEGEFEIEQDSRLLYPSSTAPSSKIDLDNSHFDNNSLSAENFPEELVPLEPIESSSAVLIGRNAVSSSSVCYVPSSLPASQNWAGLYDFTVTFGPQEKNTKGVSWTYSKTKDKLYVGKDAPCPINFSVNTVMSDDVSIRAMALYSSPENASEVVSRCVNHSMEEMSKSIFEAEHLIRCESKVAAYDIDQNTKRHSVVVPFENPPAGQHYSTYIYKFVCFGSCAGGPNRRPIMLIFSLEKGGRVVGRRKIDVKICACPGRDRKAEEQQLLPEDRPLPIKRKESEMGVSLAETLDFTKSIMLPPSKKAKPSQDGVYTIRASDKKQYDFLIQMKKFFEMCSTMNNLPPTLKKAFSMHGRRKINGQDGDSN